jgi:hypothetical protein
VPRVGAAVAWPRAIHAQPASRIYRLGIMTPLAENRSIAYLGFFRRASRVRSSLTENVILQEGARLKKTFAAFVAVATIAGITATPASAQRGVAAGAAAPGYYYGPGYHGPGPGHYDYFGSCEWVKQRFWDGRGWRVRRVRVCG